FLEKSAYFLRGAGMAGYESVIGIGEMIIHFDETLAGFGYAIAHPVETGTAIVEAIKAAYQQYQEGDARIRSEMLGSLAGEIINPLGKIDKVGKVAKVTKVSRKVPLKGKLELNPQFTLEPAIVTGGPSPRRLNYNLQFHKSNNTSSG